MITRRRIVALRVPTSWLTKVSIWLLNATNSHLTSECVGMWKAYTQASFSPKSDRSVDSRQSLT